MVEFQNIPLDVIPIILQNLTDRRDLYAATLVSWAFHRAATPLLYANLDSRLWVDHQKRHIVLHPAETLLKVPKRAKYVRHVHETAVVHGSTERSVAGVTANALAALRLCKNLQSFTWVDDTFLPDSILLAFLDVLQSLPVRELTLRTFGELTEDVWTRLKQFTQLRKVAIWCMDGPPRVLQGWSETLGGTLTHLELGRCSGVPATILIAVISKLPLLTDLRLKGAPSGAIPRIIFSLPNLCLLDTDYVPSPVSTAYRNPYYPRAGASPAPDAHGKTRPQLALSSLVVRTMSMDADGPQRLWPWILELAEQRPGLESFTLHAFAIQGQQMISGPFIRDLARRHRKTMRHFMVGTTLLTISDLGCVASSFPLLETLSCAVASPNAEAISRATVDAHALRILRLGVEWMTDSPTRHHQNAFTANTDTDTDTDPPSDDPPSPDSPYSLAGLRDFTDPRAIARALLPNALNMRPHLSMRGYISGTSSMMKGGASRHLQRFQVEDAKEMMLRPGSRLRHITVGDVIFTGRWVKDDNDVQNETPCLKFEVVYDIGEEKRLIVSGSPL